MANYVFVGDPMENFEDDSFGCGSRHRGNKDFDCCVKIENKIDIDADAKGGAGGKGGDGGDNNIADPTAASRDGVIVSIPVRLNFEEEEGCLIIPEDNESESEEENISSKPPHKDQESDINADTNCIANVGNGGDGGKGGDVNQSIYAKIDNWTVIVCSDDEKKHHWTRNLKVESDDKEVKIEVKGDEVAINGEKLDIKELEDGSKLFIIKQ